MSLLCTLCVCEETNGVAKNQVTYEARSVSLRDPNTEAPACFVSQLFILENFVKAQQDVQVILYRLGSKGLTIEYQDRGVPCRLSLTDFLQCSV